MSNREPQSGMSIVWKRPFTSGGAAVSSRARTRRASQDALQ